MRLNIWKSPRRHPTASNARMHPSLERLDHLHPLHTLVSLAPIRTFKTKCNLVLTCHSGSKQREHTTLPLQYCTTLREIHVLSRLHSEHPSFRSIPWSPQRSQQAKTTIAARQANSARLLLDLRRCHHYTSVPPRACAHAAHIDKEIKHRNCRCPALKDPRWLEPVQ